MAFSDFTNRSFSRAGLNELADPRRRRKRAALRSLAAGAPAGRHRTKRYVRAAPFQRDDGPHRLAQALPLVREETLQQLELVLARRPLIVAARDWLYAACCKEWGTPA
ncbi:hypothetical protein MJ575_25510 [Klebsiella pneumoniae]|nr:hypothetical protein MJ575_25510 [Klebsiella pneumoniae]